MTPHLIQLCNSTSHHWRKHLYNPAVDDYVKWKNIEGWVYYADSSYITIEISVRDKHQDDLIHSPKHKKHHCCVVCPNWSWDELEYVKTRAEDS